MKKNLSLIGVFLLVLFINVYLVLLSRSALAKASANRTILNEIEASSGGQSANNGFSTAPLVMGKEAHDMDLVDARVANLKAFFRKHDSPLYDLADKMVNVSDNYGFDYRLLAAIAMQESGLCRSIPENSFNCWGWGINSTQTIRFASYEEGIEKVARGLKIGYIDNGLTSPEAIMAKYAPHSTSWAGGVNHFLERL